MYNIWTISSSLKISQSSDEGDDWVGVIGDTKVRPTSVVELFHLTSVVSSTQPVRPDGIVGQLLDLNEGHGEVTQC